MKLLIVTAKNWHDTRPHVCPEVLFNPIHMEIVGEVESPLEEKAIAIINNTLKKFHSPTKWCMIAANWLPLYVTADKRKELDKIFEADAKNCGLHWKRVQFWQGGCNAGSKIINKLI